MNECNNCGQRHGALIGPCALGVFAGIVSDRGEVPNITSKDIAAIDADDFWNQVGANATNWVEEAILEARKS